MLVCGAGFIPPRIAKIGENREHVLWPLARAPVTV